jgi:hypothetical protein
MLRSVMDARVRVFSAAGVERQEVRTDEYTSRRRIRVVFRNEEA